MTWCAMPGRGRQPAGPPADRSGPPSEHARAENTIANSLVGGKIALIRAPGDPMAAPSRSWAPSRAAATSMCPSLQLPRTARSLDPGPRTTTITASVYPPAGPRCRSLNTISTAPLIAPDYLSTPATAGGRRQPASSRGPMSQPALAQLLARGSPAPSTRATRASRAAGGDIIPPSSTRWARGHAMAN